MKLHTNDIFGHSDFLRVPGPEFLGNVRAGLAPVLTYHISLEHLKKYVSIQEKIMMYAVAGLDERMEGIIKYIVSQHNLQKEEHKLRHY